MTEIMELLSAYDFYSPVDTVERIYVGNVNKTYKITCSDGEKYVLQRINDAVFKDVEGLMENIKKTTDRLMALKIQKSLDKMQVINIKFTRNGKLYFERDGSYYRVYSFMKGAETFTGVEDLQRILRAGKAFGAFAVLLNMGDRLELVDTIKDFHNTHLRIENLANSFEKAPESRKNVAKSVFAYLFSQRSRVRRFQRRIEKLPKRTVHNDTKISNVAFDKNTGEAIGVLDLDTVMRGYLAYDFADAVRSIAGPLCEDEKTESYCVMNMQRYAAFADGYLGQLKNLLTKKELSVFPEAVFQITVELAARFLTDYLDGDKYFNTEYEGQNLNRAKCQALLAADIDKNMKKIRKVAYNAYESANNV